MTPEKALAILEGKVPHREPSPGISQEKKIRKRPSFKEMEKTEDILILKTDNDLSIVKSDDDLPIVKSEQNYDFVMILIFVFIIAGLIVIHLWRMDVVSESVYQNGYSDGQASNLSLAQKELQQMSQLKEDLGVSKDSAIQLDHQMDSTRHDLEAMTLKNKVLAQNLKDMQDSITSKIATADQSLQGKISQLTQEYQKKIDDLSSQVASAQKEAGLKGGQISDLQKQMAQLGQERDQEKQMVEKTQHQLSDMQKDQDSKILQIKTLQQAKGNHRSA